MRGVGRGCHSFARTTAICVSCWWWAGCAHAPPKPVPRFADSPMFAAMQQKVVALFETDVNGDGLADAVVIEQDDGAYRAVWIARLAESVAHVSPNPRGKLEPPTYWRRSCEGDWVPGEELGDARWVRLGARSLLLLVVTTEDPETLEQSVSLLDLAEDCGAVFAERLRLPKSDGQVLAFGAVPAGITVDEAASALKLVDKPQFVRLQGIGGTEVNLLIGVRRRVLRFSVEGGLVVDAHDEQFLARLPVRAGWRRRAVGAQPEPAVSSLGERIDDHVTTDAVARPGEGDQLVVESSEPLVMLEVQHGCGPSEPLLRLRLDGAAAAYAPGRTLTSDTGIAAVGRAGAKNGPGSRLLMVLAQPRSTVELTLEPIDRERCPLRLRGFGWATEPAASKHSQSAGM